jgi:hypothetical protein
MKKLLITIVVLVLLFAAIVVGLDRWGRSKIAEYEPVWRQRIADLRAAAAARRMPVLHRAPRDENAATLEKAIMEREKARGDKANTRGLGDAASASPYAPIGPTAAAELDARRADVDELRAALACTRCDLEAEYEKGFEMPLPPLLAARNLANALVVTGHERAQAGDLAGAAERYLDAQRFGADIAQGTLIAGMIGIAISNSALGALGKLVTEAPPGAALPLDAIAGGLDALSPHLPSAPTILEGERLFIGSTAVFLNEKSAGELLTLGSELSSGGPSVGDRIFAVIVPFRAVVANAIPVYEGTMDDLIASAKITDDREARRKRHQESQARAAGSWNPIVAIGVPNLEKAIERTFETRARLEVLRLALALERRRAVEGRYPASLPDADRVVDPCAGPARLSYEVLGEGNGYRISSAGENGKDDKGAGDDIVLERKPPA